MMTLPELLHALADEVPVQRNGGLYGGGWINVTAAEAFRFIATCGFGATGWRIKPVPVPPGDLTAEEAAALSAKGEDVDYMEQPGLWLTSRRGSTFWPKHLPYRRTPRPVRRRVPLGPGDIKSTTEFRRVIDGHEAIYRWVERSDVTISFAGRIWSWGELFEASVRGELTYHDYDGAPFGPCWKEVEG